MAYFEDLTPYSYGGRGEPQPHILNIGWLDKEEPFPTGAVPFACTERLYNMTRHPVNQYRGQHQCHFCNSVYGQSNGEVRVEHNGIIYVAPQGIHHYIHAHQYKPPQVFMDAVLAVTNAFPVWR